MTVKCTVKRDFVSACDRLSAKPVKLNNELRALVLVVFSCYIRVSSHDETSEGGTSFTKEMSKKKGLVQRMQADKAVTRQYKLACITTENRADMRKHMTEQSCVIQFSSS